MKAKTTLKRNQYPPSYFEPIIAKALTRIVEKETPEPETEPQNDNVEIEKKIIFIQHRARVSDFLNDR